MNSDEWYELTKYSDLGPDPYIAVYCPDSDEEQRGSNYRKETSDLPKHKGLDWLLYIILVLMLIGGILIRVFITK